MDYRTKKRIQSKKENYFQLFLTYHHTVFSNRLKKNIYIKNEFLYNSDFFPIQYEVMSLHLLNGQK